MSESNYISKLILGNFVGPSKTLVATKQTIFSLCFFVSLCSEIFSSYYRWEREDAICEATKQNQISTHKHVHKKVIQLLKQQQQLQTTTAAAATFRVSAP